VALKSVPFDSIPLKAEPHELAHDGKKFIFDPFSASPLFVPLFLSVTPFRSMTSKNYSSPIPSSTNSTKISGTSVIASYISSSSSLK
jgi:hypothetical protein